VVFVGVGEMAAAVGDPRHSMPVPQHPGLRTRTYSAARDSCSQWQDAFQTAKAPANSPRNAREVVLTPCWIQNPIHFANS
jgi:hypothetical protein